MKMRNLISNCITNKTPTSAYLHRLEGRRATVPYDLEVIGKPSITPPIGLYFDYFQTTPPTYPCHEDVRHNTGQGTRHSLCRGDFSVGPLEDRTLAGVHNETF